MSIYVLKNFDTTINVDNPINFCVHTNQHILDTLRSSYNQKCYKGYYIIDITKIIRKSQCYIIPTNTSGKGYIDVQFQANAVVLTVGDILCNVVVEDAKQLIIGKYDNGQVQVVVSILSRPVNIGQKVPIMISAAEHQPLSTQISAVGNLLMCRKTPIAYYVDTLPVEIKRIKEDFSDLLEKIDKELELRSTIEQSKVWFFELLLYAYKDCSPEKQSIGDWKGPTKFNTGRKDINFLELVKKQLTEGSKNISFSGFWCLELDIFSSSPLVNYQSSITESHYEVRVYNGLGFISTMLTTIYIYLKTIRELATSYTDDELKLHKNVWTVIKSNQQSFTN